MVLLASACCRDGAAPLLLIFPWGVDHSREGALPSGNGRGWDGADRYLFSLLTGKQTTRVGTHFDHHPRDRVLDRRSSTLISENASVFPTAAGPFLLPFFLVQSS